MSPQDPHSPWQREDRAPYGEADTRAKLIDPALHAAGWTEEHIRREETAGEVKLVDGSPRRQSMGRTDYTLRVRVSDSAQPVALAYIEAKAERFAPGTGLQQCKGYAAACKRHNVLFVYSTNGHQFVEYDATLDRASAARPLSEFPGPGQLRERYERHKGFALDSEAARALLVPYAGGEATRRYYQDAAIRAVLEAVAAGKQRALLSLATGAGKTFIAVHLLKRLADAGVVRRALFICDRDELRSQALAAFGNLFGAEAAEVFEESDGRNHARNAKIHIATYQTLDSPGGGAARKFYHKHYPQPDTFSHILIDECHRSAWGQWRYFLERNPGAVQIGLTATPRSFLPAKDRPGYTPADDDARILRDNIEYFGEPVYEYGLAQGVEDGYLAPPELFTYDLFHDDRKETERARRVERKDIQDKTLTSAATGETLTPAQVKDAYAPTELDRRLLMPDRVATVSQHLFAQLLEHGETPEQKTILFCASDAHADLMASALGALYRD